MLFALLATGAILSLAVIWSIVQKNRFAQNVPTIEPWYPLVGNGLLFFGKNDIKKFHKLRKAFDRKDALFRLYLGPRMLLCTSDPTVAQAIMTDANCMEKPYVYKFFNLNEGVFAAKSEYFSNEIFCEKWIILCILGSPHLEGTKEGAKSCIQFENSGKLRVNLLWSKQNDDPAIGYRWKRRHHQHYGACF